jgi:4-hydroxybenzoate polyprenyltransferase
MRELMRVAGLLVYSFPISTADTILSSLDETEPPRAGHPDNLRTYGVMTFLRTWLALSRPSGLPAVWSNCLAGWWLGGGGNTGRLPFLFGGATFLYLGGAFLNDAFDAAFDQDHRRVRPIPSGAIALETVSGCGLTLLGIGALCLLWAGKVTGGLGLALACCIVCYNAVHRVLTLSPALLGICRFFLYVIGASTAASGVTGWSIWCGLALAMYVTGAGWLTRPETIAGPARYWPLVPLAAPVVLAQIMDDNSYRMPGLLLSAVLLLWTARSLRPSLWSADKEISLTTAGLAAGIVFVDLLATVNAPREISLIFLLLFGAALLLQRPARHRAV